MPNKTNTWKSMAVMACLTGCVALPAPQGQPSSGPHSQRLVIQFKPQRQACDAAGVAALSRATGISLMLVRPMGANACVVHQFASHPGQFSQQQKRIAAYDSVQWVEVDQRVQAF